MKRIITSILALSLVVAGFAQTPGKEVKATAGEAHVKQQSSYTPSFKNDGKETKVRNVILLIGDGMGVGAVNSAMYANGGTLTMTNLKTCGYVRTQSADNFTTDSAASGTAYATGVKTNNGYVGMDTERQPLQNLPEKLEPLGFACGVISTDNLDGATPASFFAHQTNRRAAEAIWADLPASHLVFASAGSSKVFEGLPLKTQEEIKAQFDVIYSPEGQEKVLDNSDKLAYFPPSVTLPERGDYLPATTQMAIDFLSARSKKGFFLMVEGARIDKEEHKNNYQGMVDEALDFDKAIEAAIRFAEKDGHTLVLISADHETGGVTLSRGVPEEGLIQGVFASKGHTPIMVPLFAYGPHSRDFAGTQENSDVSNKIYSLLTGKK